MPLATNVPGNPVSISDGTHIRLLFADNDTLWVGSTNCAVGERAATGQNINCLTMVNLGGTTPTATVLPAVTPGRRHHGPLPQHQREPLLLRRPYRHLLGPELQQGLHGLRWPDPRLLHRRPDHRLQRPGPRHHPGSRHRDQQRQYHHPGHRPRRRLHGRADQPGQLEKDGLDPVFRYEPASPLKSARPFLVLRDCAAELSWAKLF